MIRERKTKSGVRYEGRVKFRKKKVSSRVFTSRKDAFQWVTETRYKRDKGVPVNIRISINDMWEAYKETAAVKGIAPNTLDGYEGHFNKYCEPFFRNMDMLSLPIEDHERFMKWVRETEVKDGQKITIDTGNHVRAFMSAIFGVAVKKRKFGGAFQFNPYSFIEKPEPNPKPTEYWSQEEANRFLSSTKGTKYYPIWVLMLNLGLRPGEAVSLDRSQIDIGAEVIAVDRSYCKKSKTVKVTKSKLTRHLGLKKRLVVREVLYPILPETGLVFKNKFGQIISQDTLVKIVLPKACDRAGVKRITPRGMRTTFGANYMMSGGNLWDLQKELGHADIKTTERHYAHFSKGHIQDRAGVVEFGEGKVIKAHFGS